jgi:uncharacterized membrane protein (DUF2068 family)
MKKICSKEQQKPGRRSLARGLHAVALFEGAKGLLVLLVGFELLTYIHKDINEAAMHLVKHLHLNPASHYPRIFLDVMEHMDDTRLWSMALAAAMYFVVRMIEATGLWLRKTWAEWFAVLTGGMYIPIEIYEVFIKVTWPRITVLVVNIGIVSYLLFVLIKERDKKHHEISICP